MANIKARRKLSDLYKKGVEVRFGPGPDGEPVGRIGPFKDEDGKRIPPGEDDVALWIQPPSPLQREMALRDAQAARSRALVAAKRDKDSAEHLTIMAFLADMTDETLIDYVLINESDVYRNEAQREVLAYDEWKDMTTYSDAMRQFDERQEAGEDIDEDPEYIALLELDAKFGQQVQDRQAELVEAAREVMRMRPRADIERKALEKRSELVGSQAFMREYDIQMIFYSIRDAENTGELFFGSAREMVEMDEEIMRLVKDALQPFIQDGNEAKNLQGVASGSDSSELPRKLETSAASTPQE